MARPIRSLSRAMKLFEEHPYPEERARRTVTRSAPITSDELAAVERDLGWSLPEDYRALITSIGPFHVLEDGGESYDLELLGPRRGLEARAELLTHVTRWLPAPPFPISAPPESSFFVVTREYDSNHRFGCLFYARGKDDPYTFHEKDGIDVVPESDLEARLVDLVVYLAGWDTRRSQWIET